MRRAADSFAHGRIRSMGSIISNRVRRRESPAPFLFPALHIAPRRKWEEEYERKEAMPRKLISVRFLK
jgi:hypothetical protein